MKKSNKYSVLAILFFGWVVDYLDRMVMAVSLPFIGETFNLDAATLGVVLSSFFAGYALMQIPGGWLTDKFGSRRMMLISVIMWTIFTFFTGLVWSLISLIVVRFLFGIAEGSFPAASMKSVSEHFKKQDRGKAESTMLSSNPLGSAIAPLFAAPLIAWLGWRHMFLVLPVFGIILVILITTYVHTPDPISISGNKPVDKKYSKGRVSFADLMKSSLMWKLVVIWFGFQISVWGFVSWLPSYLINVKGLPLVNAGIIASLPFFAGFIALNLGGWIVDKFFVSKEKYMVFGAASIGAVCLYFMFSVKTIQMAITFQILVGFFLQIGASAVWALPLKMLPSEAMGSAAGMINFGGQFAGFVSPMVMGFLITASSGSYVTAFWFLIFGAVLAAGTALTLTQDRKLEDKAIGSELSVA